MSPWMIIPDAGHGARKEKSCWLAGGAMEMKPLISGRRIINCMATQAPKEKPAIQQVLVLGLRLCIQSSAEAKRYSVVRDFCGHGLGQVFHDAPNVMHYGEAGQGDKLREGMFFTIEPMINIGGYEVKILGDGWTAVTKDRSLSAQFEHSIGVTADGYELFTLSPARLDRPPYET